MLSILLLLLIFQSFSSVVEYLQEKTAKGCGVDVNTVPDVLELYVKKYVVFEIIHGNKNSSSQYNDVKYFSVQIFRNNEIKVEEFIERITCQELALYLKDIIVQTLKGNLWDSMSQYFVYLDDSNFTKVIQRSKDSYLVKFSSDWYIDSRNLSQIWSNVVLDLRTKLKLATVDVFLSPNLIQKLDIKEFPTIRFFPAGSKEPYKVISYGGLRTVDKIVAWSNSKILHFGYLSKCVQVTSQTELEKRCFSKDICLLVFLPSKRVANASTWKKHLLTIKDATKLVPSSTFGWVWFEGGVNEDIERAFRTNGFGYPALVALNYQSKSFQVMQSSFTSFAIMKFINYFKINFQKNEGQRVVDLPEIINTNKWDGSQFTKFHVKIEN
ncbi:hypothetical protein HZS_875 [Henneguya salminicola]|nr:hypothetical protein HZS_875 [Henneguya salminicola]